MTSFNPDHFPRIRAILERRESAHNLEDKLRRWAKPPSDTEKEKCDRAVRMVRQAIERDPTLSKMKITAFAKGSYENRTNIPSDSDVDVGVRCDTFFLNTYPEGMSARDFNYIDIDYSYQDFKKDVTRAIVNFFGEGEVTVGNKAIQVHSNSCRVDADVVPHFVHRRYAADRSRDEGVALITKGGETIYNWPQQDYDNGVEKNDETSKRYKAMVRIIKNLRCEMREKGYKSAESVASYLVSCLVWNIPNYYFDEDTYSKTLEDCLYYLQERLSDLANVKNWGEVNDLKYLFGTHQGWKIDEVRGFISDAIHYLQRLKN